MPPDGAAATTEPVGEEPPGPVGEEPPGPGDGDAARVEVADLAASTNGDAATAVSEERARAAQRWSVAEIRNIKVDLPSPHAVVVLREVVAPYRKLAIPLALTDATGMAHAWRSLATPRPLTHELFSDVLARLGATIEVVRLTGRRAGVVLAELELSSPRGRELVPCRPSNGLTLALRQGVSPPIMVDRRLFRGPDDVEPRP